MSGEDAPRPYLENLIVLKIKTNKQSNNDNQAARTSVDASRFDRSRFVLVQHVVPSDVSTSRGDHVPCHQQ
jgi:hypothetical protein